MKDNIISALKASSKALTIYEIQDDLGLKDVKEIEMLNMEL